MEKCSKPGSVIEKKAILEAHFRKKGILGLCSPTSWSRTDCQTTDNDDNSEERCYDGEFTHANVENNQDSPKLDERVDTSLCESKHVVKEQEEEVSGSSILDVQIEYSCDCTRNFDSYSESVMVEEEEHHANSGSLLPTKPRLETGVKQVLDCDDSKSDRLYVSNTIIDIPSHKHGAEDYRDATPKGREVSSFELCCFHICDHSINLKCVQRWLIVNMCLHKTKLCGWIS